MAEPEDPTSSDERTFVLQIPAWLNEIELEDDGVYAPLPPNHPFYAMVGRVASEWAHVEHVLDSTIWTMAGLKGALGACITAEIMGSGVRFQIIINYIELLDLPGALKSRTNTLLNKSRGLQTERNRIVHDPWYLNIKSNIASQFRSMPKGQKKDAKRFGRDEISGEYMIDTIGRMKSFRIKLRELQISIQDEIGKSSEKQP